MRRTQLIEGVLLESIACSGRRWLDGGWRGKMTSGGSGKKIMTPTKNRAHRLRFTAPGDADVVEEDDSVVWEDDRSEAVANSDLQRGRTAGN